MTLLSTLGLVAGCSGEEGEQKSRSIPGLVVIDDFEDGNAETLSDPSGYHGFWYTFNDGCEGTQEPAQGTNLIPTNLNPPEPSDHPFGPSNSSMGARTSGGGFTLWGAGLGINLNHGSGDPRPFDASEFAGIGFWIKSNADPYQVRIDVHDSHTSEEAAKAGAPGACTPIQEPACGEAFPPVTPTQCNLHFGATAAATSDWKWCEYGWADLQQESWVGTNNAYCGWQDGCDGSDQSCCSIDSSGLYAIQFKFSAQSTFDVTVDNLAFLEQAPAEAGCK